MEVKSKIATQFKIFEHSEKDSTEILPRNKDSEVQKHVSYIKQRLDTYNVWSSRDDDWWQRWRFNCRWVG